MWNKDYQKILFPQISSFCALWSLFTGLDLSKKLFNVVMNLKKNGLLNDKHDNCFSGDICYRIVVFNLKWFKICVFQFKKRFLGKNLLSVLHKNLPLIIYLYSNQSKATLSKIKVNFKINKFSQCNTHTF